MLFEKILRKRKISPFYSEMVAGLIYNEILIFIVVIVLAVIGWPPSFAWIMLLLGLLFVVGPLAVTIDMRPATKRWRFLINDKRNHKVVTSDVILLDYDFSFASKLFGGNIQETFTHIVYREPCLRIAFFKSVPAGTETLPSTPLKFYLMEVHFTYCFRDDCERVCEEFNHMVADVKSGALIVDEEVRPIPEEAQVSYIYFYLTYDKVHAFNRLFELVNPHEFRITSYESSGVFISIEPIPGKEYPPEALECMEKINAMYP